MKEIKFKKLEVKDFKKIKLFSFNFNDKTTTIAATNKAGKSSLIDALLWLITGKDSEDRSDTNFPITPLRTDNTPILDAETHVTLIIEVEGVERKIERKLKQKTPKTLDGVIDYTKRFKTERSFFIDGMNYKKGQFESEVAEIFGDAKTFKMLTNVTHFGVNMSEKEQRALLLSYINPVTHEQLCTINEEFGALIELEKLDFNDVLINTRKRIKTNTEEIEGNKNRIDEVKIALSESGNINLENVADKEIERTNLVNEISGMNKKLSEQNNNSTEKSNLQKDLSNIEFELENFNTRFDRNKQFRIEDAERKISNKKHDIENVKIKLVDLRKEFDEIKVKKANVIAEIDERITSKKTEEETLYQSRINNESKYFDELISRKKTEIVELKEEKVVDTCYACNQHLPEDVILTTKNDLKVLIETKEDELGKLELDKKTKLESLKTDFDSLMLTIDNDREKGINIRTNVYVQEIQNNQTTGKRTSDGMKVMENELFLLEEDLALITASVPEPKEKQKLYDRKDSIEGKLKELDVSLSFTYDDVRLKQLKLDNLNTVLSNQDSIKRNQDRLKELNKQQKDLINGLSKLEKKLSVLDEYLKLKNTLLSRELSKFFNEYITFKFTDYTQDGTAIDVFKLLVDGVPYKYANTESKINVGISMINFFQDKLSTTLPILIDNRESVVIPLSETRGQTLEMIADNKYQKLTVVE